jgi:hypothetical protein
MKLNSYGYKVTIMVPSHCPVVVYINLQKFSGKYLLCTNSLKRKGVCFI